MKKNILITGGAGFIGFNLAMYLKKKNYNIYVIDNCVKNSGYNKSHEELLIKSKIHFIHDRISNIKKYSYIIKKTDIIFNLAALISHLDSVKFPLRDIKNNTLEHIKFLEYLKEFKNKKLIYTSTRQIYGKQKKLPVNEKTCVNPTDINGINKYSSELYHRVYANYYDFNLIVMRISNVYGPGMYIKDKKLSFIGWFINRMLKNKNITIYGNGEQKRDMLYIDDLLKTFESAMNSDFNGVINIGSNKVYTLKQIAKTCESINNNVNINYIDFPNELKKIDIGSFSTDNTLARKILKHKSNTSLKTGLELTYKYYKKYKEFYL